MTRARPFLGETDDREKAFADFKTIDLTIIQDPFEQYATSEWQRTRRFTKADLPRRLECLNPRCQQGGLDLQQIVEFWASGKHHFSCNGHEGTPQGRRVGQACDNSFEVTVAVVRREKGVD